MSEVATVKTDLAEMQDLAFSPFVDPADKAESWLNFLHNVALVQIKAETNDDSPWLDPKVSQDIRDGRLEFHAWTRALEITANLQKVMEINLYGISGLIWRKRFDLFPVDGTWRDLSEILEYFAGMSKGRAGQVATFIQKVGAEFEKAGVAPHAITEIIQEHSRGGQIGLSILAPLGTAGLKALHDPDLTPEERAEKMQEVAEHARSMTVNDFENEVYGKVIPQLTYQEQTEDDGSVLFVFKAKNGQQASLLRGRMRDAMVLDEGLFRPLTAMQIVNASKLNDWEGLIRFAVLSDRVCRVIHGMMEATAGPCDYEYFEQYSNLSKGDIESALQQLTHFKLALEVRIGGKKLWEI